MSKIYQVEESQSTCVKGIIFKACTRLDALKPPNSLVRWILSAFPFMSKENKVLRH
jgi:hypothetical protein